MKEVQVPVGYRANADAYRAGYAHDTSEQGQRFYSTPGPDRIAYQAGWSDRRRADRGGPAEEPLEVAAGQLSTRAKVEIALYAITDPSAPIEAKRSARRFILTMAEQVDQANEIAEEVGPMIEKIMEAEHQRQQQSGPDEPVH